MIRRSGVRIVRACARSLCVVVFATIVGVPAFAAGKCTLGKLAELPITMKGPRALTTVKFNGQDVQLAVDSGAAYSVLSPASAAALNLKTSPLPIGITIKGLGGSSAEASYATVKTMTIAGEDLHNVGFLVGGSDIVTGVLGRNILHLGDVEYDFEHGFVRLFRPKDCSPQASLAYWSTSFSESPLYERTDFQQAQSGPMHAQKAPWMYTNIGVASLNGSEIHVLFDTGSPVSSLSLKAAAKVGITPESPGVIYAGDSYGVGRATFRTYIARFESFKIGQEEIKNAKLRLADIELQGLDMILGMDFALSHRIYVANSQHKMYFTYNGGRVFDLDVKPKAAAEAAAQTAATAGPAAGPAPGDAVPAGGPNAEDADEYARRGEVFESRHELAEALGALDHACELAPDNPEYLFRRGLIHVELRQPDDAMKDFDHSLELRPNSLYALLARGELKVRSGDKAGARVDLDAADAAAPKQANERYRLAVAYARADQSDAAIRQISLWIDSHGDDALLPNALNERCWVRALHGTDLPLALKDCTSAMHKTDKTAAVFAQLTNSRGLVYLRMGDIDKSIADYDQAIKLRPKDAWAWYGRGVAKVRKNRTADGKADMAAGVNLWPGVAAEFKRLGIVSDDGTGTTDNYH